MAGKLLWGLLPMVLAISLSITACEMIPSKVIPEKNIATVESISWGESNIFVYLKPTEDAKASTSYTVDLFESGRFRASQVVSWTDNELKIFANKKVVFPVPFEEVGPYIDAHKNMEDIFTVKVYETPKTTTIPYTTKPQNTTNVTSSTTTHPSTTITYPSVGEVWHIGDKVTIHWASPDYTYDIYIQLSYDNGNTWGTIISQTANTGSHDWIVIGEVSTNCKIRICKGGTNFQTTPALATSAVFSIIK